MTEGPRDLSSYPSGPPYPVGKPRGSGVVGGRAGAGHRRRTRRARKVTARCAAPDPPKGGRERRCETEEIFVQWSGKNSECTLCHRPLSWHSNRLLQEARPGADTQASEEGRRRKTEEERREGGSERRKKEEGTITNVQFAAPREREDLPGRSCTDRRGEQ